MIFVDKRDLPQYGHVRARRLARRGRSLSLASSQVRYRSTANDTAIRPVADTGMPDAILR